MRDYTLDIGDGGELVTLGVVAKGGEQGTMRINYNNKSETIPSLIC